MTRYWICNRDGNGPTADHANDDDARAWSSDYPTDASWAVPDEIRKAEGLTSVTWENDACLSYASDASNAGAECRDAIDLRLWVEHPISHYRESGGDRYVVAATPLENIGADILAAVSGDETAADGHVFYSGDDPRESVVAYVRARHAILTEWSGE